MTPVFDAYVTVDWSADSRPKTGRDSIWICCLERSEEGEFRERLINPPTRSAAIEHLADLLSDLVARDRVGLVGFDFAFGFPSGFAARLRPDAPTWRSVWKEIAARVRDGDDNANNRYEVAQALNARASGTAFPFWGCPASVAGPLLSTTKPQPRSDPLPEHRLTDRIVEGPQPVWKLAYAGNVGSQTLLGIARLNALRHHPWVADAARLWPFETGLEPVRQPTADGWRILFAEVYPSMLAPEIQPGEVKDAAQMRALARHFAALDARAALAPLFAGPSGLDAADRARIEREEGWILGIETAAKPARTVGSPAAAGDDYVRDPEEIYRRSFAIIRAEADLDALPPGMQVLAVRLIHACGMPDIVGDLAFSDDVAEAGLRALASGAPILVDTDMVAAGIIRSRLAAGNRVVCTLAAAKARGSTRSAAAVDLWRPHLAGAVVAIGNAPTALFRLLELLRAGAPKPAVILGFPVGFVGAAESKEALIAEPCGTPFATLRGRRGGSALAAAAVNALVSEAS